MECIVKGCTNQTGEGADKEIDYLKARIKQLEENAFGAERVEANLNRRIDELEQQLKETRA